LLLTKETHRQTSQPRHESRQPPRWSLGQSETLALRAAFLQGARAVAAWQEFSARYDFDDLFPASSELLPIVYANLAKQGWSGAGFGKVQGLQRKIWYGNQLLLKNLALYIKHLEDSGIEPMLAKNSALALQYYEHPGLRNIRDFDLVVRRRDFGRTLRILEDFGLRQLQQDSQGRYLNLQSEVIDVALPGQEKRFWNSASRIMVLDSPALALSRPDQLFYTILNKRSYGASISMWIADVLTIAGTIRDTEAVLSRVHNHRIAGPIKHSIGLLLQAFPEGAESPIIEKLQSLEVSNWEKLQRRLWASVAKSFKADP
jgi:hypothetical protein